MQVTDFLKKHYKHFNAAALIDAAEGYKTHLDQNGKMMITLAGAMSTAELGISLAEMIRQDKIHIISCTGANLEEDIMNLVAHDHYERIPNWRDLTPVKMMALDQFVLWNNAESPYKTAKEYFDAVKAAGPSKMKMGGTGSKQEDQIITAAIEQSTDLSPQKRSQWASALRQIGKALDKPMETLPARWTSALRSPWGRSPPSVWC